MEMSAWCKQQVMHATAIGGNASRLGPQHAESRASIHTWIGPLQVLDYEGAVCHQIVAMLNVWQLDGKGHASGLSCHRP